MSEEKDILFIVDRFYPTDEAFVEEVYAKILPQMGYNVELIMRSKQTVSQSVLDWHGNKLYIIPNDMATTNPLRRSWRNLKSAYLIYKISQPYRGKILIVRNWSWGLLAALLIRPLNGYKLIYQRSYPRELLFKYMHKDESGIIFQLKMLRMNIWANLTAYAMKRCDAIFPVSEYMKIDMVKEGIDSSIMEPVPYGCVIPPDSDQEKMEQIRNFYNLSGKQLMLYFGTFNITRRLEPIINAFGLALETCPNAFFILVGGLPKEVTRLEKHVELRGLSTSVKVIGKIPRPDVVNYLSLSQFTVSFIPPLDGYLVSTPMKLIESLVCGIPVLANELPIQKTILDESGGGLCIEYDDKKLTEGIKWFFQHPAESVKMGESGRDYIRTHWTFEAMANKMQNVFESFGSPN